jgi:hypothetical protein
MNSAGEGGLKSSILLSPVLAAVRSKS